jgi:hypothetical protein
LLAATVALAVVLGSVSPGKGWDNNVQLVARIGVVRPNGHLHGELGQNAVSNGPVAHISARQVLQRMEGLEGQGWRDDEGRGSGNGRQGEDDALVHAGSMDFLLLLQLRPRTKRNSNLLLVCCFSTGKKEEKLLPSFKWYFYRSQNKKLKKNVLRSCKKLCSF